MQLVTWNLAGRVKRLPEQATLLLALAADVISLQELAPSTLSAWSDRLQAAGYHTLAAPDSHERPRPLRVLTAAREPLHEIPLPDIPWPERVLAARLQDGSEIVNVHSPTSPKPELAKTRTHEAVFAHLANPAPRRLRVLCGDLNTPRKEHADGTIWTFARDQYGRLRPDRGEAWDRAELALIQGLHAHGFHDVYRQLHGYQQRELSWEWPRWGGGYRLDHLLISGPWQATSCRYLHPLRKAGLSDHSPLLAQLQPAAEPTAASFPTARNGQKPPVPTQRQCSYTRSEPHDTRRAGWLS